MKKLLFLFVSALFLCPSVSAQIEVSRLLIENKINPAGVSEKYPHFSWVLTSTKRNARQSAFDLRVAENPEALKTGIDLYYSTGKIPSDQSVYVQYTGNTLKPGRKYYWQVRVWDQDDRVSKWSEVSYWIQGIMGPENWQAKWIQPGYTEPETRPSPLMRREFQLDKPVQSAVAFISAHGLYEAQINGKRVGDQYLTPGWTSYNKRLQYQTYDVTALLSEGKNAVGVTLGNGWYRGRIGFNNQTDFYGKDIALLFQMQVIYTDGTMQNIVSDGSWRSSIGPIVSSQIYDGETYDARLEKKGWSEPGFIDVDWSPIKIGNFPVITLVATENEPIRKKETVPAVRVITTPKGEKVIDFGQNLVGWVQLKATGKAGDRLVVQHAEVLDKDGNFYTANLRSARQTNTYILKGEGEETFEPHFTFQGFRFVKVEGYPGELKPENVKAFALCSDMQPTGTFSCSDDLLNKLQSNIRWSQMGNFLDVPTDCPQRDERLGWTGDAQAFASTAAFNFNVHSFYLKWLKDVSADQAPNGAVPYVVPNVLGAECSPGWGDVATIAPWTMYRAYGDRRFLENQYASMKAWVDYIRQSATDNRWRPAQSFGDWLFFRPDDDNSGMSAVTDKDLIAQCFYAHSTQLLANAARILDMEADTATYDSLLVKIKEAFVNEYLTPSGRLVSGSQTAYVLALAFGMLPENMHAQAVKNLVENIKKYDYHLTTGFLGTPYLCQVLSENGETELAYRLLLEKSYPSWLYPVTMGATTIWERWDGIKPNGSFQTPDMNSFNHYAYGAIGDWMYRVAAGIQTDPAVPGYKSIVIKPAPTRRLSNLKAELDTYYGKIGSSWEWVGQQLVLTVTIPVNTVAKVYIPASSPSVVREGGRPVDTKKDTEYLGMEGDRVVLKVGAGTYRFTVN